MNYGSIHSRQFMDYCSGFTDREEMFSKLNTSKLKVMQNYYKWSSSVNYKKVRATCKIGNDYKFCGLSNDIVGMSQLSCLLEDSNQNIKEIKFDDLDTIGASETEKRIINNISDEVIAELEYMCYIIDNDLTSEFEHDNYSKLRLMLDKMYDSENREEDGFYYCHNTLMVGLPLPQKLIEYYNKELVGLYNDAINRDALENILTEYSYPDDKKKLIGSIMSGSGAHLLGIIRSYISTEDDMEKRKAMLRLAIKFQVVYWRLSNNGKTDFTRLVDASKQTAFYITTALGERLATKKELKSLVSGVYKKDTYYLSKEKRNMLLLFGWAITGNDDYYVMSGADRHGGDFERVESNYKYIWESLVWLGSDEFITTDIKELSKGLKNIQYPDKAEDEVKDGSLVDMLRYISKNASEDTRYEKIALDIAQKCIRYKNYYISEKQLYIVNKVYAGLTGKEMDAEKVNATLKNGKPNLYSDELIENMREIVRHPLFNKNSFPAKIIDSVVRFKKCSEKQYAVIDEERNRLRLVEADPMKVFGFGAQEISADNNVEKNKEHEFFIDDDDEEESTGDKGKNTVLGSIAGLSDMLGSGSETEGV